MLTNMGGTLSLRVPGFQWIGSNVTNGNDYVNNGQQPKILLHMTVSMGISASYAQDHPYPPQRWASPYTGDRWQSSRSCWSGSVSAAL